jgi:MFS family permease
LADLPPVELPPEPIEALEETDSGSLWSNGAFRRLWAASTISVFGSLVTRMALPFVAILTLNADAFGVALLRSMDIIAALAVGLVAGAWVDRLRRRPLMIWTDIGRAVLLASIPVAAIGGWLSLPQLLLVAFLAAVMTTFFDVADNAYLPTIVPRRDLVRANGAIAATGSVSEFGAFGASGFLVQLLSGPLTIAIDAVTFVVSALFLGTIRAREAPPPPITEREPVRREIAVGLRLVSSHPVLRASVVANMGFHAMWGVFGATWYLFAIEELGLDPATIGVIAAMGGVSSLFGALLGPRLSRRLGVGRLIVGTSVAAGIGSLFIPLAPAGAPLIAIAFLLGQQLVTDPAMTIFDINDVSIRQAIVHDRQLGRVNATIHVMGQLAMLVVTLGAGVLALLIGLRLVGFLSVLGAVLAFVALWFSPIRRLKTIESVRSGE